VGRVCPRESGRETTVFRHLVPVLVAGLLPAVVVGAEASGTDSKTRLYGRVCTPEGKPAPGIIVDCLFFDPHREADVFGPVAWQLSDEEGRYEFLVGETREYIEMPPQWRGYWDAEAFVRHTVGTKVQKRIDFTLPDLEGHEVSLASDRFRGKVVLVNFFSSWCGGCRLELPHLVRLKEKYGGQGLEVIGLAFAQEPGEAGKTELRKLLKEAGINYVVLFGGPTVPEHDGGPGPDDPRAVSVRQRHGGGYRRRLDARSTAGRDPGDSSGAAGRSVPDPHACLRPFP
jgi:thiol-disulfide isomerase/thioredoxin